MNCTTERQLTYVHGFDDLAVIAGQGTIGLELLDQVPDLDAVIVPIGGAGLIAGVSWRSSRSGRRFRSSASNPKRCPASRCRWRLVR